MVPNNTLKKMLKTSMMPVFLKPINRYLSPSTFWKLSVVTRLNGGSNRGEVLTISAFVLNAANSVKRIGASTMDTMQRQITCFTICCSVRCFILSSLLLIRFRG